MNGGDNPLIGGLISPATLVATGYRIGYATFRNGRFEAFIEDMPRPLIHGRGILEHMFAEGPSSGSRPAHCSANGGRRLFPPRFTRRFPWAVARSQWL